MKKIYISIIVIFITGIIQPVNTFAIPAFARNYGFNCMMCHTAYARLNDFGQRFRDNGYQIPGQEGKEKTVFDQTIPVSMRLSMGYTGYSNEDGNASSFNLYGFDLLAAGVLHKNISFLLIYTPRIDVPASDYSGPSTLFDYPSQEGALESVSLIFSNIIKDALNVRVGRFEPAYHVFSSKRSYYLFQPYEVYTLTTPNNNYSFDENQIGIEATGHFRFGFKYAAGVINGNGGNSDNNNNKDMYLNVTQTIGKGDGQTAGQRIGLFGYYGWQPLETPGTVIGTQGQTNGTINKKFYRIGATGGLNYKMLSLQAMYMIGTDDKAFDTIAPVEQYKYNGGFVELNYAALANNRLVASLMYNWVNPSSDVELTDIGSQGRKVNAFSALLRYYLGGWKAVNIAIHAEYTHKIGKIKNTSGNYVNYPEDMYALALDFAF
jgi:hypothetical protein